ncbi:MAG TPA: hypothetical protein VHG72_19475 [Polyangia bacterium]|nr:hypothetical protein [Polyangia bacterium]
MTLARAAFRGRGERRAGMILLLGVLLSAAVARAEPGRRVVLVVPEALGSLGTQVLARVRGELQAARFEVETQTVPADVDRRATVERALRKADARVAFGIFFGGGSAEIWVSDSLTGRSVVQTLPLGAAPPERRATVAAVKAVDLLKATLAEVWIPAPAPPPPAPAPAAPPARTPPETEAPAPPPPEAPLPPPEVRVEPTPAPMTSVERPALPVVERPAPPLGRRLDIAAGAAWIGAGSVNTWSPLIALTGFRGHWGGHLTVTGFGSSSEVDDTAGTARLAYTLALAEVAVRQPIGRFEIMASAGAGATRLSVQGSAGVGYNAHSGDVWSAVAGGGIGAALVVWRLTLAVDARLLASGTSTAVRIAGDEIVQVGRPLVCVGVSVGVRL